MGMTEDLRRSTFLGRPYVEPTESELFIALIRKSFPRRAVDVALEADVQAPAIAQLAAWSRDHDHGIAVLSGATGCGKTVAVTWLALQKQGRGQIAPKFLRASEFAGLSRYDADARARWSTPWWLVLDDLGAEYLDAKGSFKTDLDELVDVFYAGKRTLVITTNCAADDFAARYGERVVDRLREAGTWIAIAANSMRRREP